MHAAALMQLLPPGIAPFAERRLSPAKRWVVVWCLLLAAQDAVGFALSSAGIENLWLGYVGAPITGAVALWMLSLWNDAGVVRLALRGAIPLFVVVSVVLSVGVDDPTTFSVFAAPFHALVLLLASLLTFLVRSFREDGRMVAQAWFWTLAGLMLYAGADTAIQAMIWYLLEAGREDLIVAVFNVRAVAMLTAFAAIAGGMLCPLPPTPSGGPSSRPSLPSGSSSGGWRSP